MSIIYVTDEMFKDCFNTLNDNTNSLGTHEYSQELFSQNGVNLRLESNIECISKVVVDKEAKAAQDKRIASKANRLKLSAAAVGLTVDSYLEKQRETAKANRIKSLSNQLGISIESATAQVELEEAREVKTLKTEFYREKHPETVNEAEGFSTADIPDEIIDNIDDNEFKAWRRNKESELAKEADPTKEVVVIKSVTPLHVVYSFDEGITGMTGFDTIAKTVYKNESYLPAANTFKALFKEYVDTDEFKKGLAFLSRIVGNELSIKFK